MSMNGKRKHVKQIERKPKLEYNKSNMSILDWFLNNAHFSCTKGLNGQFATYGYGNWFQISTT